MTSRITNGKLGPGDRYDDQREGQEGNAEGDVGEAHDRLVDLAAEIAGDQPDQRPEDDAADGRDHANQQGDARAVQQLRQHIATLVSGPEQGHAAWRHQSRDAPLGGLHHLERPVRGDQRPDQGDDDEHGEQEKSEGAGGVADDDSQRVRQGAEDAAATGSARLGNCVR